MRDYARDEHQAVGSSKSSPSSSEEVRASIATDSGGSLIIANCVSHYGLAGNHDRVPGCFTTDGCLTTDSGTRPRYLYYSIHVATQSTVGLADGTTQPNLNAGFARRFILRLPPLAEQKAIAAVLGALDDKIELNRRMNATLEAMARALFQSWFVDFDPVRAKLDGRHPPASTPPPPPSSPTHFEALRTRLHPARLASRSHRSSLRHQRVDAWQERRVGTLEYVEISEVSRGNIANIATYKRGEEPSRARRRMRHGDTVLSTVRPDRGSYFLALNPPENRVASTGFAVLTPTKAPWSFVHAAMTQPGVFDHLGQMADGGAYPAVRPEVIAAMQVVVPNDPKILEAFHRICAPLLEQAEANRLQSRTLAILRDTLLPKLLSGELSADSKSLLSS